MHRDPTDTLRLSASDLSNRLACNHLSQLDRQAAEGNAERPHRHDPALELQQERGRRLERTYIDKLRAEGRDVVEIEGGGAQPNGDPRATTDTKADGEAPSADHHPSAASPSPTPTSALDRTLAAMRSGAGAIVQAHLAHGRWTGRADALLRVEEPSDLGDWSYEVVDTKLSQETRGGTVLQLCLYTDLVGKIQGREPTHMYVAKPERTDPGHTPDEAGETAPPLTSGKTPPLTVEPFRFNDYAAYYRQVKRRLEAEMDAPPADTYPEPVEHCEVCAWWPRCDSQRRRDDHLSLVAGMHPLHREELRRQGVETVEQFASRDTPLDRKPERGHIEVFERLHGQAQVQIRGRQESRPVHERLAPEPGRGLARLPAPSWGDVFFDLEADAFVEGGGLEYLFGYVYREGRGDDALVYRGEWALTRAGERAAFERFVDFVMARWDDDPGMYVYHFGGYEQGAVKRLMTRYASRGDEVDRLLRAERFVDLHAVTRQGIRASVERYSLKDLEAHVGFARSVTLDEARLGLQHVERALELEGVRSLEAIDEADRRAVQDYNEDDCRSTAALRDWLEAQRSALVAEGHALERPELSDGAPTEGVEERNAAARAVFDRLTADISPDPEERDEEQDALWLLAHLLEYFRREDSSVWWEFHRLHKLDHDELLDERKAVTGLEFVEEVPGGTARCPVHRYRFPNQEVDIGRRENPVHEIGGKVIGDFQWCDPIAGIFDVKKRQKQRDHHPTAVQVLEHVPTNSIRKALLRLAESVLEHGIDGDGPYRAARDLVLRRGPRRVAAVAETPIPGLVRDGESPVEATVRLAGELDHGVLAIQGPPGAGKTFTAAKAIATLAAQGNRIGITAFSHKAIRNLINASLEAAQDVETAIEIVQKVSHETDAERSGLREVTDSAEAVGAIADGVVVAGTSWLWADDDAVESLDYLFVDEAGQLSLAQLLAAARAARNIVLLGDPQQLQQPQQGSHPEGAGASALVHLLGEEETIGPEAGVFLDETWRMHPDVCAFTSEVYYKGRLRSREGLDVQVVRGCPPFEGSGLRYVPVEHTGNPNMSPEEVEAVARIVAALTAEGATWTDRDGAVKPLTLEDILIVAPYNAHVRALSERLGDDARVGTVDRFQGQEAAVVVYSMASSSVADAPRGMAFVFDPNRFNVATSRARCMCVLVAAPGLLEVECRTPRQMRWANGVGRFLEMTGGKTRGR